MYRLFFFDLERLNIEPIHIIYSIVTFGKKGKERNLAPIKFIFFKKTNTPRIHCRRYGITHTF